MPSRLLSAATILAFILAWLPGSVWRLQRPSRSAFKQLSRSEQP